MNCRTATSLAAYGLLFAPLTSLACGGGSSSSGTDDATDATATATTETSAGPGGPDTGDSSITDDTGDTGDTTEVEPAPAGLRRVLSHQYVASVELLLGAQAAAVADPPNDPSLGGFDVVAAAELSLSPSDVEQYERSANAIARATILAPQRLAQTVPCVAEADPADACFTDLARDFGRLAWRRPLTNLELATYAGVGVAAKQWDGGTFMTGVQYLLVAMLQSPRFLYIVELGTLADDGGPRALTQHELAARLSFFLAGRTPDAALLDRADAGTLDEAGLREAAWALLDEPGARDVVARFYDELLTIRGLRQKGKDPELFPSFGPELAASMREETQRLIADIVFEQDGDVLDLIDSEYTWVDANLAALYGVAAPPAGQWAQFELPAEQRRAGILTHAGVLAMFAHGELNSPTRRGLFVQEHLLCTPVPPTPPDVNPTLPDTSEPMTLRQRLEETHLEVDSCAGCHLQMDPIGFAYEHFDPIGAYRTTDNGFPIDSAAEDPTLGGFADAAELAALVRDDPRLPRCLVDQVYTSALGFRQTPMQMSALDDIGESFVSTDHNMRALLVEIATSPLFRFVDEPK